MSGSKGGRPTSYRPEYVTQAEKLCRLGAIDEELADFFEVSVKAVKNWRVRHEEFSAACRLGKEAADQRVQDSLFKMATGFRIDTEKLFVIDGRIVRADTTEYINPSPSAAIFWLKNRAGWRDQQDVKHSGGVTVQATPLDQSL